MAALHPRTYYLWSIGCQMNKADSMRLEEELYARGYTAVTSPEQASLLIMNTCVVRQSAEDKVTGRLLSLRPLVEPDTRRDLLVMGCFVGDPAALAKQYPFVAGFYAPSDTEGVMQFVDARDNVGCASAVAEHSSRISELVPISYGCDHHCTYCIVQLRRGPQRSRSVNDICLDVERLVARGAREITLLGQNVDAYGHDLPSKPDLADLLLTVHEIAGLQRIRFLTSHPRDLSQRIIDTAAALPRVCQAWELPVQSGDDQVLKRMARGYTAAHYRELVGRIRKACQQCVISTDIIVGFPGETDEQFQRTLEMVRELCFDMVHVASYSVRPGTAAARWDDDVPAQVKEARRVAIETLQTEIARQRNEKTLGQVVEVLVDGKQKGRWRGRTRTNHLVFFSSTENWLGRLAPIRITWAGPWSLIGEPVLSVDTSPAAG